MHMSLKSMLDTGKDQRNGAPVARQGIRPALLLSIGQDGTKESISPIRISTYIDICAICVTIYTANITNGGTNMFDALKPETQISIVSLAFDIGIYIITIAGFKILFPS